jgi:N-methylhydantoinase A
MRDEAPVIGIDTGGTFTDVVAWRDGRVEVAKVLSTPGDPALAVAEGLRRVGGLRGGGRLHHGTTVGTNAVLTRSGARVALVVPEGFEDVLEIGRGARADLHALRPSREPPLVPRSRVVGARQRTGADGRDVVPLAGAAALAKRVAALRPEAVAVCLLHATRRPAAERALVRALRRALPRSVPVRASAALSADPREAERAATAVLDAYIAPAVAAYVARVARLVPSLTVVRSDGGRMSAREAARAPVRTLLSGPAAGVAAAHALAIAHGEERALSFDVGGTSTDVAWIDAAGPRLAHALCVGPHVASVPSLEIETIGAGGGSVVALDAGGALVVGPGSAGADPGPACYGRGGPLTLTDAWLLLGRLPEALLGGDHPLDRSAAERAARPLARRAGASLRRLLEGAVAVATAATARALRRASAAAGRDPRGATLLAFGGAGPLLAAETATAVGLSRVLVPERPGAFAAEGTLLAPLSADESRVAPAAASDAVLLRLGRALERLVERRLAAEGAARVATVVEVDARHEGQAFDVTVPLAKGWRRAFHAAHRARWGFAWEERGVDAVRVSARGRGEAPLPPPAPRRRGTLRRGKGVVARADLATGAVVLGPSRVEETTGTTWVPAGWRAEVLPDGVLRLEARR